MAISGIETIQNSISNGSAIESSADTLDKNEFLMLFVTQLQNQDPLSPMDNAELAAQTAQFASLEQLQYLNENIVNLQKYQSAIFDENAVLFIDKFVRVTDNAIELKNGEPVDINFDLEREATAVYVSIYDANGNRISEVEGASHDPGPNRLIWDGNLEDGVTPAPEGTYYVEIKAVDHNVVSDGGQDLNFEGVPFFEGTVTDVNFWNGTAYLTAGGREISLSNVQKVSKGE